MISVSMTRVRRKRRKVQSSPLTPSHLFKYGSSSTYCLVPTTKHKNKMTITPFTWATVFVIVLSTFLVKKLNGRRRNLPPGPKPWPIIGNLNLIGPLPHRSIHELSKKHGPLMFLHFGSCPVVVGSSVDMAKVFLKTQDLNFVSRPKMAAGKYSAYNYTDIAWSPYGPYWRQARKICWMELFTAKRIASYKHIRVEEMCVLLRSLFQGSGSVVTLRDLLGNFSLNIMSRIVLGKKYTDDDGDSSGKGFSSIVTPQEFKSMIDELFQVGGVLNIGDSIPWLNFLDLQGYIRKMKKLSKKFDRFLEHVLDGHDQRRVLEGDSFVPKDMVDVLLHLADDPCNEVKLERNGVKAFTLDLLAGGTESSAVTAEWALSEILKTPRIFALATEELDRVVGKGRWVEEEDMSNLPYIDSVIKETMRLHPPAPFLVPRLSREDSTVNGYHIPAGTRVLVNVWTIGRDPTVWEAADEFRPERFIGKTIDIKGNSFELLPFGAGRRMCPGYNLGLMMIELSITNLLHGFKWGLPGNMAPDKLDMKEKFGLTTPRDIPLQVVVEPRLAPHLYL